MRAGLVSGIIVFLVLGITLATNSKPVMALSDLENATFVKVVGTFYDGNGQVVATDYTYTNPSDIAAGDKDPFEIILTSSSVPNSQIDHYNLVASSQ